MKKLILAVGAAALVMGLAACGDDGDDAGGGGIVVEGQWARTSPMAAEFGAAYMTIRSSNGDTLVGASVDPSIAGTVELHETKMVEGDATMGTATEGTGMPGTGEMEMVQVQSIDVPADNVVVLEPGGLHIMLIDLVAPLEVGSEIEMTLTFETAGDVTVTVPVREDAP